MRIKRTDTSPTQVTILITADAADIAPIKQKIVNRLAPQVKVPGFRAGKVPPQIVEKNIDQNLLQTEVLEECINRMYQTVVTDEKLRPIDNPEVAIKKYVPYTDLEFSVDIAVIGPVKLPDYTKIKLARKPVEVSAADVTQVIKSLQKRMADRTPVARAAKKGDELLIDFTGTDQKGEPVAGADGTDYPLMLGSDTFIPGFEDNLIGLKESESKTFDITFPADYGVKALQKKTVTFAVTVKQVNEMVEPKVDDAFATKAGPFKTVEELKKDIKAQLRNERQQEADQSYENELLRAIAAKTKVEIPDVLINDQIDRIETEEKQNLMYRGQTFEEHLKEEGISAEEHRDQKRPAAIERVTIGLILSEIADREQILVTPEELEIRMQLMKGQYRDPAAQAELDKPEARRDIVSRIMTEKTIATLVTYATKK